MRSRFARILLLAIISLCALAHGQIPGSDQGKTVSSSAVVTQYTLSPAKLQKAHALYEIEIWLGLAASLYAFLVLFALLHGRVAVRYRNWAERASRNRFIQALVLMLVFVPTLMLLTLPPELYGHSIGLRYGLSVQAWGSWFRDWAVQMGLLVGVGSIIVWILYAIIRRSPRRWWFYFWLAVIPISAFLTFISPAVIEPMFNQYRPLQQKHPQLVTALEEVIQRTGLTIPPNRMYEMIASAKVTGPNAYVTGFGATKRVVVWDTSIREMTTPQLMFVFGHELGHYVLNHIVKGFIFGILLFFFLFYVGFRVSKWMERRWGTTWGIRGLEDWASLPLLILVITVLWFLGSPIANAYSRHLEHQADQFGLEVVHGLVPDSPEVAAQSFQVLGEQWLDYPYPSSFAVFWDWNHPPIGDRVRFALSYRPWDEGKRPEFVQ